jgi:hypothetical protein
MSKGPAPLTMYLLDLSIATTAITMTDGKSITTLGNEKCGGRRERNEEDDEFKNQKCELFDPINRSDFRLCRYSIPVGRNVSYIQVGFT